MSEFGKTISQHLLKAGLIFLKHAGISIAVCLLSLSLVTGKFPPPIKDTYQLLKAVSEAINMGANAKSVLEAKKEKNKIYEEIDQVTRNPSAEVENGQSKESASMSAKDAKIKSLEYEVALLKSKLYRAQAEAQQFKSQQQVNLAK